jgi:hypothetical protein
MRSTVISGEGVFTRPVMAGVAYFAASITRLVSLEVVEGPRPAFGNRSSVTVMRIEAIVDVAVKAVWAVKPGTRSKKHAAYKPIGPVITVRSAVIWGIVVVPIRAHRSQSNVYADGNLGGRPRHTA